MKLYEMIPIFINEVCMNEYDVEMFWNRFKYYKKIRQLVGDDFETVSNEIKRRIDETERDCKVMKLIVVQNIHERSNSELVKMLLKNRNL